jgi:hypothetical protein
LVYCPIVKQPNPTTKLAHNEIPFPTSVLEQPALCFHGATLLKDDGTVPTEIASQHPTMTIIPHHFAPRFIFGMIGRLVLLTGLGARGPGQGFPLAEGKQVSVGVESISKRMKWNYFGQSPQKFILKDDPNAATWFILQTLLFYFVTL